MISCHQVRSGRVEDAGWVAGLVSHAMSKRASVPRSLSCGRERHARRDASATGCVHDLPIPRFQYCVAYTQVSPEARSGSVHHARSIAIPDDPSQPNQHPRSRTTSLRPSSTSMPPLMSATYIPWSSRTSSSDGVCLEGTNQFCVQAQMSMG